MKAAALLLLLAAAARAERPVNPPAPEFPPSAAWLNAARISMAAMRGRKVALIAFVNPTSIHSVRVLPALKEWFDRYALSQLMVIAVLTPDLACHRDPSWVKGLLKRHGIEYPVVLDADRGLWTAYANEGWPALYLVDRRGRVIFDRLGEGGYLEFERELRSALADLIGESALPPPTGIADPRVSDCGGATPEILLGARPGAKPPISLNQQPSRRRALIVSARDGEISARGLWEAGPEGLRLARNNRDQGALVRVIYHGAQALAVLSPAPDARTRVFVKLDDLWLHEGNAGKDVAFDDDGRSYVALGSARLYDVVRDPAVSPHALDLIPDRKGAVIHAFSFSDSCLVTVLP